MPTCILISMFSDGFHADIVEVLCRTLNTRGKFAFVASEFERGHEKTDKYFRLFLAMFERADITFDRSYVVDGRMTADEACRAVSDADVVWLSGGNTPVQFAYLHKYGLDRVIANHGGVVIGMSAGSINMAKTSVCTRSCGHAEQLIYPGLGCVDITVEPHFDPDNVSDELLCLSESYIIHGLCDGGIIMCRDGDTAYYGEVYRISSGSVVKL